LAASQVPNGELTSKQLRALGDQIRPLGEDGCGDITTRANIQLRGMTLAEADKIFQVRSLTTPLPRPSQKTAHSPDTLRLSLQL
jgi:hypothetical protein